MKKVIFNFQFLVIILVLITGHAFAQVKKERVSPADSISSAIAGSTISVRYSKPSVKGRKIWGELVPYNKVWRTGANEATVFETIKDIKIEGKTLPAGKYALFTIPGETEWTFIFNKTAQQWGAFKYDEAQDQLRVKVKPGKSPQFYEQLTFLIVQDKVVLRWENLEAGFKISK